ncbi:60S acidic ribosomal protein P1-like [Agrilus planipennis]|uniref:Large ribosomal subunit protein P1 n=1 Tax=Agrilus planipennis TaxID=224129 RepID=A0A1W4X9G2_AGRPL|nr:60S acidic ribosomal protein P1 [Agrilus planipennis]XP_018332756.1 60S acidic ribosomal protein P1 [Agrilus planipennis]XP_025830919.1 60S acidic ribosomal protein P1-like [Agrilus planipennis]XP_025830920.1 60S acidic ribosomal protein P1-like [Agrilus planipennis]
MAVVAELACVYSSLILADDDVAITSEKIQTILKAANVDVEPYWSGLFAKALEGINIKDLITKLGSSVGATSVGQAAVVSAPAATENKKEEAKKEEKKEESEESDDDMGLGLFD